MRLINVGSVGSVSIGCLYIYVLYVFILIKLNQH
nr:MAG TPA: hypothetical protein [Caudoviricetes sp.]